MKISAKGDNRIQIELPNGIRISTIWGYCTHTENYDGDAYIPKLGEDDVVGQFRHEYESSNVEVMVSSSDDAFLKYLHERYAEYSDGSTLFDYMPIDVWVEMLNVCRTHAPLPTERESGGNSKGI